MATFAALQLARLETLLAANVGVQSVSVDGTLVSYDNLLKQYDYWSKAVARETGSRPRAATVDLTRS